MYKLSELIGKEAITLLNAKKQGVLFNAHFDDGLKFCKYFSLINCDDEIRWVEFKNVLNYDLDAVVIRCEIDVLDEPKGEVVSSPINLKAFNQDGKMLGFIKDIELENGKIVKFITDLGEIDTLCLLSISEEILVFNDTGKPIKLPKIKEKSSKIIDENEIDNKIEKNDKNDIIENKDLKKEEIIIKPREIEAKTEKTENKIESKVENKIEAKATAFEINKPSFRYSFLLGKRLLRDILDSNGGLIARENDLVTQKLIEKAKEKGKLVTLALHSL